MLPVIQTLGKGLSLLASHPKPNLKIQLDASSDTAPESPNRSPRSPRSLRCISLQPAEADSAVSELRTPSPPSVPLGAAPDLSGADLLLCLPTPVCLVDRQGRALASNPAFRSMIGDKPGFLALLPPQEQTRAKVFLAVGTPGSGTFVSNSQSGGPRSRIVEWTMVASPRLGLFVVTARYDYSPDMFYSLTASSETLRRVPRVS